MIYFFFTHEKSCPFNRCDCFIISVCWCLSVFIVIFSGQPTYCILEKGSFAHYIVPLYGLLSFTPSQGKVGIWDLTVVALILIVEGSSLRQQIGNRCNVYTHKRCWLHCKLLTGRCLLGKRELWWLPCFLWWLSSLQFCKRCAVENLMNTVLAWNSGLHTQ